MPRPNSATASGRPAATIEPKAISRITAAAIMPMPSGLPPSSAFWITTPPTAICTSSVLLCSASRISSCPVSGGTSQPRRVAGAASRRSCRRATRGRPRHRRCRAPVAPRATKRSIVSLAPGCVRALPRNGDELTTAIELLVQQLSHFLRLRAPGPEVGIGVAREHRGEGDHRGQRGDPSEHHAPAAAVCEVGQPAESSRWRLHASIVGPPSRSVIGPQAALPLRRPPYKGGLTPLICRCRRRFRALQRATD